MDILAQFCPHCGAKTQHQIPKGDNRLRRVCTGCQVIHYDNPQIVTGAVCLKQDNYLLCLRAIDPRKNFWTIPAGFLEQEEDVETGAKREAQEEAGASIEIRGLLGVYSLPYISQIQLFYLADVTSEVTAGIESLELAWYSYQDIPWSSLAFATVHWALEYAEQVRNLTTFLPQRKSKYMQGETIL